MAEPSDRDPRPGEGRIDATPGLAGGPGPAPPGVDDGTPAPRAAAPEAAPAGPAGPPSAEAQRREGEAAERSAGTRRADVPGLADEGTRRGAGEEDPAEERTRR